MSRYPCLDRAVMLLAVAGVIAGLCLRPPIQAEVVEPYIAPTPIVEPWQEPSAPALDKPAPEPEAPDWRDEIPLDRELVNHLVAECDRCDVPVCLALAIVERESQFQSDALNPVTGCYGLMQLNPDYFPSGLDPAGNISAGVAYLGKMLATYGDYAHAVTAYYYGPTSRTSSWYSDDVLALADAWAARLEGNT